MPISELLEELASNMSARALARIVGMRENLMLQYKGGFKNKSEKYCVY